MSAPPHILHRTACHTITLIDIPRSIEDAQYSLSALNSETISPEDGRPEERRRRRRLFSSRPLKQPFPSLEPKSAKAKRNLGSEREEIQELLLRRYVEFGTEMMRGELKEGGKWCLARCVKEEDEEENLLVVDEREAGKRKRPRSRISAPHLEEEGESKVATPGRNYANITGLHLNSSSTPTIKTLNNIPFLFPPHSTALQGSLPSTLPIILQPHIPQFNIMLLDPPWPNRSARRSKAYATSYNSAEIYSLLVDNVPVAEKLVEGGYVAVWITNREVVRRLVLGGREGDGEGQGGLFGEWGVEFVEEWVWLKVTEGGEPVVGLDARWRRPWEVLLIGKKMPGPNSSSRPTSGPGPSPSPDSGSGTTVKRKLILGVPDLHSRKPNLKFLFEELMGKKEGEYQALEVFARNLTSGWWSWGDEVLRFQDLDENWSS